MRRLHVLKTHPTVSRLLHVDHLMKCDQFIHLEPQTRLNLVVSHQHGGEGSSKEEAESSDRRAERSLEESRKLILEWADELRHVDKVSAGVLTSITCSNPGDERENWRLD